MSQDVFQMKMDPHHGNGALESISIHDDIVVYRVSEEDHDANLVKPPQCSPKLKGLVLKQQEIRT